LHSIGTSALVEIIDVFGALGGFGLHKSSDFLLPGQEIKWPHDGCHPNDFGYFDIANAVSASISRTFHFPTQ